ncbi:ATP-binding protein DrrA1-3 family domain-containing protein, partial [Streptomyces massasporeus]
IRDLVTEQGVTIFLTTQYLEEADHLADRIAVLDHGKLVAEGTAEELKRLIPGGHVRVQFADETHLATAAAVFGIATRDDEALALQIPSDGSVTNLRAILDALDSTGVQAESLTVHTPDLDDVFLTLTGKQNAPTAQPRPARRTLRDPRVARPPERPGPPVRPCPRHLRLPHPPQVQLAAPEEFDPVTPEVTAGDLAGIEVPVLVAVGAHDLPDFRAVADDLTRLLPGARRVDLDWAGHLPALERPAETAGLLTAFLAEAGR